MTITGEMFIGAKRVRGSEARRKALAPALNQEVDPVFHLGGAREVDDAARLAATAFDVYRHTSLEDRAVFLENIAKQIEVLGDALIERAHLESALPVARLQGERARTVGQLRLFAQVVRAGRFLSATVDTAQPERKPLPRSDLRLQKTGLGPVAVFGASNFPLAFSVAGGDTASALAAGCPVVVKAHEAHLGTSELVAGAVARAVAESGLPEGVFSLIFGAGNEAGAALVAHPAIKAVGFTGSRRGGLALVAAANSRPEPIPVYAEMSSINPVYLFPHALAARGAAIGQGFASSLTMGVGQFCTNPGLVIALDSPDLNAFVLAAAKALSEQAAGIMLTPGICEAYQRGSQAVAGALGVKQVGAGLAAERVNGAQAFLYETDAKTFLSEHTLQDEVFGPSSLVVRARDMNEVLALTEKLEGQLTATLFVDDADYDEARRLMPVLERKAGRILANGYPTGVEVSYAMVHGGPFPATSNAAFTSVGASAIDRFLRPVCYQDLPDGLLPVALQARNPAGVPRLVDGQWRQG